MAGPSAAVALLWPETLSVSQATTSIIWPSDSLPSNVTRDAVARPLGTKCVHDNAAFTLANPQAFCGGG